jgi:hypothetical protein
MKDLNYNITAQSLLGATLNRIENTYSDILSTIVSTIDAELILQTKSHSFDYTISTKELERWGIDFSGISKLTIIRFLCEYYHKKRFIVINNTFQDNYQITICWGNFIYKDKKIS